ncbi:MAG: GNAT family N-acetyltransferase [Chloroflexi bacterium]|nr:GNAT family N-acetyltransferase [Chloroflexota bacterium]
MRIVVARRTHVAALAALMVASPLLRRYGVTPRRARASLNEALRSRDTIVAALDGADVQGLAWLIVTRALDRSAYLRLLLVADGERSRGLGASLLADAERRVRLTGSRHIVALVTTTNRRARSFYSRHGYRRVGVLRSFARPAIDEALYVKSLGASAERSKARIREAGGARSLSRLDVRSTSRARTR